MIFQFVEKVPLAIKNRGAFLSYGIDPAPQSNGGEPNFSPAGKLL
jgi:hypothetical protein